MKLLQTTFQNITINNLKRLRWPETEPGSIAWRAQLPPTLSTLLSPKQILNKSHILVLNRKVHITYKLEFSINKFKNLQNRVFFSLFEMILDYH